MKPKPVGIFPKSDARHRRAVVLSHECEMVLDGPFYNPTRSIVEITSQIGHSSEIEARLCAAAAEMELRLYGLLAALEGKKKEGLSEEVRAAKAVLRFTKGTTKEATK